jgi:hypothetical protein
VVVLVLVLLLLLLLVVLVVVVVVVVVVLVVVVFVVVVVVVVVVVAAGGGGGGGGAGGGGGGGGGGAGGGGGGGGGGSGGSGGCGGGAGAAAAGGAGGGVCAGAGGGGARGGEGERTAHMAFAARFTCSGSSDRPGSSILSHLVTVVYPAGRCSEKRSSSSKSTLYNFHPFWLLWSSSASWLYICTFSKLFSRSATVFNFCRRMSADSVLSTPFMRTFTEWSKQSPPTPDTGSTRLFERSITHPKRSDRTVKLLGTAK